ncbi:hypothetical protein GCM10007415_03030 [Parapedobacter pyrenivorans]|uniref:Nitrite/Sulfite reductase ferredoxin-like domain-containing protein n=2 Tax=Parapedobacter pyrenivorans TaxID=1305674 RepID=A0A917M4H7_9SPHI|nr:hypothetical protein GCM10007415_03030 [Parapedobacter pyrenivorans]
MNNVMETPATLRDDKHHLVRVFIKGGMVTPEDLMAILEASGTLGNEFIFFGSRQDILFPARSGSLTNLAEQLATRQIDVRQGHRDLFQNLVSSTVAIGITNTTEWLDLGSYRSVLDAFAHPPQLKINITDPRQAMVPLFTGDLNFVASAKPQYWYLYLRNAHAGDRLEKWPTLVHSTDIAKLSVFLEQRLLKDRMAMLPDLIAGLAEHIKLNTIVTREDLRLPTPYFPCYEGMESLGDGKSWLGLYWRNNRFHIPFLVRACQLCIDGRIPYFYITPWKSFVIKDIRDDDRLEWERLMGGMGINMRHSSLELNWHIPVLDEEALQLKQFLVGELDQQDICTHGLTFSIITEDSPRWFTSIVIKRKGARGNRSTESFDLYYAERFDPNTLRYFEYAKGVAMDVIPALLVELSKSYYSRVAPKT